MTVGIKEKERKVCGKSFSIIVLGSIIQSGENVKLPPCLFPLFSSYTTINYGQFSHSI